MDDKGRSQPQAEYEQAGHEEAHFRQIRQWILIWLDLGERSVHLRVVGKQRCVIVSEIRRIRWKNY